MTDIVHKNKNTLPRKIGLALGSGSARGWAHIGVIKALTEAGIQIDYVAGTSIGAVVGAVYASGNIKTLEDVVLQFDWKKIIYFLDVVFPKSGLIDGNRIAEFVRSHVKEKNIEDLLLPFCAIATDLATGNELTIREGNIIEAVRASIAIPGIFTPSKRNNRILVDGGLVNPVPVSAVREMGADLVIAVDLNHDIVGKRGIVKTPTSNSPVFPQDKETDYDATNGGRMLEALQRRFETLDLPALTHIRQWMTRDPAPNIFEIIMSSISIMEAQITAIRLKTDNPDMLIQPHLGHIRFLEFNKAQEAIVAGYEETELCIQKSFVC